MNIETTVQKITPSIAENMLLHNHNNRALSMPRVRQYAEDMKAGRWKLNPNPISFDVKGNLIDGQTRLNAVILSGCTVQMIVSTGYPADTMEVIDFGKPRTASDILKIEGYVYNNVLPSIAKRILAQQHGSNSLISAGEKGGGVFTTATKTEIVQYCKDNFEDLHKLAKAADIIIQKSKIRLLNLSEIAFLLHALKPEEKALEFVTRVVTGVNLQENTPELALRLIVERVRYTKEMHIYTGDFIKYFYVAFEKFVKGQPCKVLKLPRT